MISFPISKSFDFIPPPAGGGGICNYIQAWVFGKLSRVINTLAKITVNGISVDYVKSCKYLGFYLLSHNKLKFSFNEDLRGFFGSINSILSSVQKPRENVLMQLLYSNCVPKLTFGAPVKEPSASEMNQMNVSMAKYPSDTGSLWL